MLDDAPKPSPSELTRVVTETEKSLRHERDVSLSLPSGTLSEKALQDFHESILASAGEPNSILRIAFHNAVIAHREALKKKNNRKRFSYLAALNEYYPQALIEYFDRMERYIEDKKKFGLDGSPALQKEEESVIEITRALGEVMRDKVALAHLRGLLLRKSQGILTVGVRPIDDAIAEARRALPDTIVRKTETGKSNALLPKHVSLVFAKDPSMMQWDHPDLVQAAHILDHDLSPRLSFSAKNGDAQSPLPEKQEIYTSPADSLYLSMLLLAGERLVERFHALSKNPKSSAKELEEIIALRQELHKTKDAFMKSRSPAALLLASYHEVFREYDPADSTAPATERPFTPQEYKLHKEQFDKETDLQIEIYRKYFAKVREIRGPLDSGGWEIAAEHSFNKVIAPFFLYLGEWYAYVASLPAEMAAKLPIVPDSLGTWSRDTMISDFRVQYGLPADFDFSDDKSWQALTPEKRDEITKNMKEAMQSTKEAIDTYKEAMSLSMKRFEEDLSLLQDLRKKKHPDELVNVVPDLEGLQKYMKNDRLQDSILHENDDRILRAAHEHLKDLQLFQDWEVYTDVLSAFTDALGNVEKHHFMRALAGEQMGEKMNLSLYYGALAYGSSYLYGGRQGIIPARHLHFYLKRSLITRPLNAGFAASRDIWKIGKKVIEKLPKRAPRIEVPRSPLPSAPSRISTKMPRKIPNVGSVLGWLTIGINAAQLGLETKRQLSFSSPPLHLEKALEDTLHFLQSPQFQETVSPKDPHVQRSINNLTHRLFALRLLQKSPVHFADLPPFDPQTFTSQKWMSLSTSEKQKAVDDLISVRTDLVIEYAFLLSAQKKAQETAKNLNDRLRHLFPVDPLLKQTSEGKTSVYLGGSNPFLPPNIGEELRERMAVKPENLVPDDAVPPFQEEQEMRFLQEFVARYESYISSVSEYQIALKILQSDDTGVDKKQHDVM